MFRFFAVVGFSYFVTLALTNFIPIKFIFASLFLMLLALITVMLVNKFRKDKVLPIALFTAFIALSVYTVNFYLHIKPVYDLGERDLTVSGKIVELPSKNVEGRYNYIFKVESIVGSSKSHNFKIKLSSSNPIEADIYDDFTGDIHIFYPQNTPEFAAENFYRAKGIYALGFLYEYRPNHTETIGGIKPIYYYALKARKYLISSIDVLFPQKQASVVNGILFGDKSNISNDVKTDFDRIGVYHLLAVSGIHITILSRMLIIFLKRMRLGIRLANIISIFVLIAFMAITCFTPSVVRAGIMSILYLLGLYIFRNSDSINSLGAAVLLITLFNINSAGDVGLWLSFLSTLGIIVLEPIFRTWIQKKIKINIHDNTFVDYTINLILVTISSCIFTMPVIFLYYRKFSVVAVISNILLISPVTTMLVSAIILIFLYLLSFPIFIIMPLKILCGCTINYIIWCSNLLSCIPFASASVDYLFIKVWIAVTLILIGIVFFYGNTIKNIKFMSLIFFNLLFVGILIHEIFMYDITRLSVLNLGEGCAVVLSRNGRNSLILYGNEKTNKKKIVEYLYKINAYKMDYLIIPSYGGEDIEFINSVKELYNPDVVLLHKYPDVEISSLESKSETENIITFRSNFDSVIWSDIKLSSRDINGNSFSYLNLYGKGILICPYGGELNDNLGNLSNCDVLIASGLPTDYERINSTYIIFSMSKTDSAIVSPKFSYMEDRVFSTAFCGTVNIDIKKSGELSVRRKI